MPDYNLVPNVLEVVGWLVQLVTLAVLQLRKWERVSIPNRTVSLTSCALVLCVGWVWRLTYAFVLASTGFWYFVGDDAARWLISWGWARNPYLITWDGIWQGGTFYVHGAAMRVFHDPMAASKFVSAAYNVIPLVGMFLFTDGIYRDRKFAILTVLFVTPWWLHILLGTGTMAEMPMIGLLLAGIGLFALSTYAPENWYRGLFVGSALCFAASTTLHMVAWMMLSAILLVLLVYAARRAGKQARFGMRAWLLFTVLSTWYCVLWFVACWIKFGRPFDFLDRQASLLVRDSGITSLSMRLWQYPKAVCYLLLPLAPLLVAGIIWGFLHQSEARGRVRAMLIGTAMATAVMLASAVMSNPDGHGYRSMLPIATVLLPISLAPLRPLLHTIEFSQGALSRQRVTATLALVVIALLWTVDNHQKTFRLERQANELDANALALGTWLRAEMIRPQALHIVPDALPVRIWSTTAPMFSDLAIQYSAGFPNRIELWAGNDPGISSLQNHQYLITDRDLNDARLIPCLSMGRYRVYQCCADANRREIMGEP